MKKINHTQDIWLAVVSDMKARRLLGIERYGRPVKVFNGRNALQDAYEEALDLAVYMKQALLELHLSPPEKSVKRRRRIIKKAAH